MADLLALHDMIVVMLINAGGNNYRFATDYYTSAAGAVYLPTIINTPEFQEELSDIFYGISQPRSITVTLANRDDGVNPTWYTIDDTVTLRGATVTIGTYNTTDGVVTLLTGILSEYSISDEVTLTVENNDMACMDLIIPKKVTADIFSDTGSDIGAPINICFGWCRDVPLRHVKNDLTNDYYDYLICDANAQDIQGIFNSLADGLGVKRDGVLVDPSEYTFYNGTTVGNPYPGYAVLRFTLEQRNFGGQFHSLTADIKGYKLDGDVTATRDFQDVIDELLTNSDWGPGEAVDAASFVQAATDLAAIGTMYCDLAITEFTDLSSVLAPLLLAARATLRKGSDSEWEILIDKRQDTISLVLGENDSLGYNNCAVEYISYPSIKDTVKTLTVQYRRMCNTNVYDLEKSITVHSSFGVDRTIAVPTYTGVTVDKVLAYLKNRCLYGEKHVTIRTNMQARDLDVGDKIKLHSTARNISSELYKIDYISKALTGYTLGAHFYTTSIYNTTSVTNPTSRSPSTRVVYGPHRDVSPWISSTANFSARRNSRYYVFTSGTTGIAGTLPTSPVISDTVMWQDAGLNFRNAPFDWNGTTNMIEGTTQGFRMDRNGQNGTFIFHGGANGWKLL